MTGRSLVLAVAAAGVPALAEPRGAPAAGRADRTPTACTVAPRTEAEVAAILAAATPEPKPESAPDDDYVNDPSQLPQGEPADDATVTVMTAATREFAGCINAGDFPRWLALMTDRAVASLDADEPPTDPFGAATPIPDHGGEPALAIATVRVRDVWVLPDGRVGAVAVWGVANNPDPEPSPEANVHIFARVDGRWLLDEEISGVVESPRVLVARDRGVAVPGDEILDAPGGYGEVDSALYAEPTMMGAQFTVSATFMVAADASDGEGVGCGYFTIERGAHSVTVSATCRAEEALAGLPAYLDVEVSGERRSSDASPLGCRDAAPLAASITYACTVDLPASAP